MPYFRSSLALLTASLLALSSPGPALAQTPSTGDALDPTVIVLDASGSMTAQDTDGQSRMDSAKQAVGDFLDQSPPNAPLGLVTYGTGTGSGEEEKEAGCRDITVLSKPGEKPTETLKHEVNGLNPRGYTPMGNALLRANDLLPKEGKRSIVLVSDGIDTCAPPPVCEVAKQLKEQGTDLVVHTIGFMVDDAARSELQCVADVTGGTYADASSAESLKATLSRAATRTGAAYQLPDTQIHFAATRDSAPELPIGDLKTPANIHAILPPGGGNESFAKVKVPAGMRLQVGYTVVPKFGTRHILDDIYGFFIVPRDNTGTSCYQERSGLVDVVGDHPASGFIISKVPGEKDNYCEGEYMYLGTKETFDAPEDMSMTLALVPAEPSDPGDAVNQNATQKRTRDDLGAPAAASDSEEATPLTYPDPKARSIAGTVVAEIVEGETQYFPTDVAWGQALDVTVEVLEDPAADKLKQSEKTHRSLNISVLNELGQPETTLTADKAIASSHQRMSPLNLNKPLLVGTERPISFANAAQGSSAWLGGKHFVQVSFSNTGRAEEATETTQSIPLKYRLTFTPRGDAAAGPTFATDTGPKTSSPSGEPQSTAANGETKPTSSWTTMLNYGITFGLVLLLVALIVGGIVFLNGKRRG